MGLRKRAQQGCRPVSQHPGLAQHGGQAAAAPSLHRHSPEYISAPRTLPRAKLQGSPPALRKPAGCQHPVHVAEHGLVNGSASLAAQSSPRGTSGGCWPARAAGQHQGEQVMCYQGWDMPGGRWRGSWKVMGHSSPQPQGARPGRRLWRGQKQANISRACQRAAREPVKLDCLSPRMVLPRGRSSPGRGRGSRRDWRESPQGESSQTVSCTLRRIRKCEKSLLAEGKE